MVRKTYVMRGNICVEVEPSRVDVNAPAVWDDTMRGLRHPVTGKIYDSKSRYMRKNRELGLEVVGNDLLSKKARTCPEKVTDELILDRIYKAESIFADPSQMRAREYENRERLARRERLINGA